MEKAVRERELLHKWILYGLLMFMTLFVVTQNAEAAVTGKIAGVIIDVNTGEPLPGANVLIEGTDRGAACDADGYYYIIRLDPGDYTLQARMMGYEPLTKTGIRVESGHTTPVNFELGATIVPGEGVTIQAQREVIKMDLAGSVTAADKSDIEAVPLISDVASYLNLQAGIDGWSVRSSGLQDTRLMADGLLLVDNRINEPIMMPNLSEIKEVSLLKGGFSAEYSNVRAGVINVITREGSPKKYEGSFEFRFTPGYQKHSAQSIFDVDNYYNRIYFWNKLDTGWVWDLDTLTDSLGNVLYDTLGNILYDTLGTIDVIKYDSVFYFGPENVWGRPRRVIRDTITGDTSSVQNPFYDTLRQRACSKPDWDGWLATVGDDSTVTSVRQLMDRYLWYHRIDIPRTDSLFDIYSNGMAYIPVYSADGDTLLGFSREPYTIPEDQPRIGSYGDKPDWTLDAGFGGPVPIIGPLLGDLTFYTSYRDDNEAFPLPDSKEYFRTRQATLKLTSRLGDMKFSLKGAYSIVNTLSPWATGEEVGSQDDIGDVGQVYLRSPYDMIAPIEDDERDGIDHGGDKIRTNPVNLFNPNALTPFDITSRMYGLTFQHALSENTFYDVRLTYLRSNNDASFWYDIPRRMNDTLLIWFADELDDSGDYIVDESYRNRFAAGNAPYGYPHPDYYIPRIVFMEDISIWGPAQMCGTFNKSWSQNYNARVDFTSQINKYNQIKAGLELNYDKIHEYYIINEGFDVIEPGKEDSAPASQITRFDAYPILAGLYLQDKIEFEGMFANIGLRFDYSNPNIEWVRRDSVLLYSALFSGIGKELLFETDSMLEKVPSILKLSPRVGISFPILEKSKLFFNYGHFYSLAPNLRRFRVSYGKSSTPLSYLGNPALDMARTISYEVGFESSIANQFLARVTGYYKDNDNEFAKVRYANYDRSVDYYTYENLEYSDTRGFEVEFRKSSGRFFTGWVLYDYKVTAKGQSGREEHYAYAVDNAKMGEFDAEQTDPLPQPVWTIQGTFKTPLDWGAFLGGYNLALVYSWKAGGYYTYNPFGTDLEDLRRQGFVLENNIQWEADKNLDLSLSKIISVGGISATLFMDIHNVFDWHELNDRGFHGDGDKSSYLASLHLEMYNDAPYTRNIYLDGPAEGEAPDHPGELSSPEKPYIDDPNRDFLMYLDPRYVQFGIRFSF